MMETFNARHPHICLTENIDHKQTLPDCVYGSFAFKDRMTNSEFNYIDAINRDSFNKTWLSVSMERDQKKTSNVVSTYKFTKKFEMKCIKDKYKLSQPRTTMNSDHQRNTTTFQSSFNFHKAKMFKDGKEELRRVLRTGDKVSPLVIKQGQRKEVYQGKKIARKGNKWLKNMERNNTTELSQGGQRVYEKAINHMNHQLRHNCQYLLDLPVSNKREMLIRSQFKRNADEKENNSSLPLKEDFNYLQFEPIQQPNQSHLKLKGICGQNQDAEELLNKASLGYVNEVYEMITTDMKRASFCDNKGNNIFHIVAREGNFRMLSSLFRVIPYEIVSKLLQQKNKLGRIPEEKSQQLGNLEMKSKIQEYIRENKPKPKGGLM